MQNLASWCVRLAVLYALFGMVMGEVMASSGDHSLMPVHAHINVLGWVSLALFGIVYKVWDIPTGKLAWAQFGLFNVGIVVQAVGVTLILPPRRRQRWGEADCSRVRRSTRLRATRMSRQTRSRAQIGSPRPPRAMPPGPSIATSSAWSEIAGFYSPGSCFEGRNRPDGSTCGRPTIPAR